jgi:hypothetical protein
MLITAQKLKDFKMQFSLVNVPKETKSLWGLLIMKFIGSNLIIVQLPSSVKGISML